VVAGARLRISRKAVANLTPQEVMEARRCTMRSRGAMEMELVHQLTMVDNPVYEVVDVYRLRDLDTREMVGWGLVWGNKTSASTYVYVLNKHRRKGCGTRIMGRIAQDYPFPRLQVSPHNRISYSFFRSTGVLG